MLSIYANLSTARKLIIAFGVMLLVTAGFGAVTYNKVTEIQRSVGWTQHTSEVITGFEEMFAAMLSQEAGVRGYLVAGTQPFLEPYTIGLRDYTEAFERVKGLMADNPVQSARLQEFNRVAHQWNVQVGDREILLMGKPETREAARGLLSLGIGKAFFASMRQKRAEILKA